MPAPTIPSHTEAEKRKIAQIACDHAAAVAASQELRKAAGKLHDQADELESRAKALWRQAEELNGIFVERSMQAEGLYELNETGDGYSFTSVEELLALDESKEQA